MALIFDRPEVQKSSRTTARAKGISADATIVVCVCPSPNIAKRFFNVSLMRFCAFPMQAELFRTFSTSCTSYTSSHFGLPVFRSMLASILLGVP